MKKTILAGLALLSATVALAQTAPRAEPAASPVEIRYSVPVSMNLSYLFLSHSADYVLSLVTVNGELDHFEFSGATVAGGTPVDIAISELTQPGGVSLIKSNPKVGLVNPLIATLSPEVLQGQPGTLTFNYPDQVSIDIFQMALSITHRTDLAVGIAPPSQDGAPWSLVTIADENPIKGFSITNSGGDLSLSAQN